MLFSQGMNMLAIVLNLNNIKHNRIWKKYSNFVQKLNAFIKLEL